ncbi:mycofactocin-coupled SDR family oxidoreductase [Geodermatophilus marinus]|uniref:mycofactocin-coupled SDR family oxidoreductase n=1 Tax=Geodermatophilus sp. LHW52908 TaxID=2303986 RepID=UPI000E3E7B22|nr:mycofactocin-coupled SDR family oxidoreductase [Geodermatophilus sp. LHW52908]RFU22953.1 NAD(P)-dependent oxidoreductase [Geodermatophilus sp. LHW52908]
MAGRVEGKVAFITGAARGQGRSHAVRLAQEGADIIAVDLCEDVASVTEDHYPMPSEEDLARTAKEVEALDRRIVTRKADVRDFDALKAALDEGVEQLGHVDIVSANAGIFTFGPTLDVTDRKWGDVIDINLTGVFHTCKAAIPHMIEQGTGGSIILTSSTAGLKGFPNVAAYTAAKHGVVGLMRTLGMEFAQHNIRVNTVHPTGVATDMIFNESAYKLYLPEAEHPTKEEAAPAFQETNALPVPWVEPIDVSNALLFLASDEARYVTGTELKVDAGFTLQ